MQPGRSKIMSLTAQGRRAVSIMIGDLLDVRNFVLALHLSVGPCVLKKDLLTFRCSPPGVRNTET